MDRRAGAQVGHLDAVGGDTVISRDLVLLDRMSRVSRSLGIITANARVSQVYGEDLDPDALREIGRSLRSLGDALIARADELDGSTSDFGMCAWCGTEPVARPRAEASMVDSRFCADCIDQCLCDVSRDHWCPVDAFAQANEAVPEARP